MLDRILSAPPSEVGSENIDALIREAAMTPAGVFVEVGVYKGGTAWHLAELARAQHRTLYLYDTFTGTPFQDEGDVHIVGQFGDTSLAGVRAAIPDAVIVQGVFPDSLEEVHPGPDIAFVHVDCDQYRSVKACIDRFSPFMVTGGKMWFDDYPNIASAKRAIEESFGTNFQIMRGGKAMVTF